MINGSPSEKNQHASSEKPVSNIDIEKLKFFFGGAVGIIFVAAVVFAAFFKD